MQQTSSALWLDFRMGGDAAFEELYNRFAKVLFSFGKKYTPNDDLIYDCIHDLFIDLHRYRETLGECENVQFYLMKAFRRKLVVQLRQSMLKVAFSPDDAYGGELPVLPFVFSIEHDIIEDEQKFLVLNKLAAEIALLPDRQREILYLRFNQGMSYEQIAELMQISVPTCRTFNYRALKQLKERMESIALLSAIMALLQ